MNSVKRTITTQRRISPNNKNAADNGMFSNIVVSLNGFIDIPANAENPLMRMVSCRIPIAFYNVSKKENRIYFSVNGGIVQYIEVEPGNYTFRSLQTAMAAALQTFNIAVNFNSQSGKFRFTATVPFVFLFDKSKFSLCEQIGFADQTLQSSVYGSYENNTTYLVQSHFLPNLQGETVAIFYSPDITTPNIDVSNSTSYLLAVPLNAPLFGVAVWENMTNYTIPLHAPFHLNTFRLEVKNGLGEYLDFQHVPWELLLEITYSFSSSKIDRWLELAQRSSASTKFSLGVSEKEEEEEEQNDKEGLEMDNEEPEEYTKDEIENNVQQQADEEDAHMLEEEMDDNEDVQNTENDQKNKEDDTKEEESAPQNTIEDAVAARTAHAGATVSDEFPQFNAPRLPDTAFNLTL